MLDKKDAALARRPALTRPPSNSLSYAPPIPENVGSKIYAFPQLILI